MHINSVQESISANACIWNVTCKHRDMRDLNASDWWKYPHTSLVWSLSYSQHSPIKQSCEFWTVVTATQTISKFARCQSGHFAIFTNKPTQHSDTNYRLLFSFAHYIVSLLMMWHRISWYNAVRFNLDRSQCVRLFVVTSSFFVDKETALSPLSSIDSFVACVSQRLAFILLMAVALLFPYRIAIEKQLLHLDKIVVLSKISTIRYRKCFFDRRNEIAQFRCKRKRKISLETNAHIAIFIIRNEIHAIRSKRRLLSTIHAAKFIANSKAN